MRIFLIEGTCENSTEVITLAYWHLLDKGAVKESFLEACLRREEEYPTGLPTGIPVAIPHTFAEHVNDSAICAVRLASPVKFQCMGEPEEDVFAEYAFIMALNDENNQLAMLKRLMKLARNEETLGAWKNVSLAQMQQELEQFLIM